MMLSSKMLLKVTKIVILLALSIHYTEGFERVIIVTESDVIIDDLFTDDNGDDISTRAIGSGSALDTYTNPCCAYENCSCPSLYNALDNLTGNVLINITTDVELPSIIPIIGIFNIAITGHNSPIVYCNNSGGLHFISCYNCTIEGITWEGCGAINIGGDDISVYPVLQFTNSSNITIQNCSFQQSIGQAVVLSGMSGDVNIYYCNFLYNKRYEGHGIAIHYSSTNMVASSPLKLMINNCKCINNGRAKSIMYFSKLSAKLCKYLELHNCEFHHNKGVPIYLSNQDLHINGNIKFSNNIAESGGGIFISDHSNIIFYKSATVNFTNNTATNNGGAIFLTNHSSVLIEDHPTQYHCYDSKVYDTLSDQYLTDLSVIVNFYNNRAYELGDDIYVHNSNIIVGNNATLTFDCRNGCDGGASSVYTKHYSIVTFQGNSEIIFQSTGASNNGGAMYISDYCTVTFKGNSIALFDDADSSNNGGAMYISNNSNVTFEGNSTVLFNDSEAYDNGGAMYISINSYVTSKDNSTVTFHFNMARFNGGAMYITNHSTILFKGNSIALFNENLAHEGGAMCISSASNLIFEENSTIRFNDNEADNDGNGGAMYISTLSYVASKENSRVTFHFNMADHNGGAMYITDNSDVLFKGNSTAIFDQNSATIDGAAMYISTYSQVIFKGNSTASFSYNEADRNGGAVYIITDSVLTFDGNCRVTYNNNAANDGGALYITHFSGFTFDRNSVVTFNYNHAISNGGSIYCDSFSIYPQYSYFKFQGNSKITFNSNEALNGGAMYIYESNIKVKENCSLGFYNNKANNGNGGAMFANYYSNVTFAKGSASTFHNNMTSDNGGAFFAGYYSGAIYTENSTSTFIGNIARLGGAVFIILSDMRIQGSSSVNFTNNVALRDGGAIYLSDDSNFTHLNNANVTFYHNTAEDFGGAIYVLMKGSSINFTHADIYFKSNRAGIAQNSVYINVPNSCNSSCLFHNVYIANISILQIKTSPYKLILHNPTKCINGTDTTCDTYYIDNIMLGQDITFDACVLDYYDQPTEATQFIITGMKHQDYNTSGSKYITISCNHTTQGITVIGNLRSNNSFNYSVNISLYATRVSESEIVSANLIVELSQCHPGFQYCSESQKCECYVTENIVSCSGGNSTIKRGYWFGRVSGKSTITSCPNDYCDFTCCEITNGIYHLSPVRENQCRPHRSGTACGNCEKGYTLSFDSPDCVEVNKCTTGQTVLVITLSLLYWIAVVVAVFVMMYFKVTVGSLYAIIYYYSVVDILLSQLLFISNGLYTTVNIMSSLAKLTPQFLGQLCLVQNMSGIDQQFIHYVHPTVISLILIMIVLIARRSRRVSSFVGRGIIHFICFLLLLSYTSVATTSLLLMRPLTFIDVNKVYAYLSPDVEYLHGRHLVYTVVAIIFAIVIVIGLPLLLVFEPFLNAKINFVKIKPLLDQFQGCYKDKYRCFAGYYMVCRLVIILLVIVKVSDDFTNQYLLISSCTLMALIHVLVRPYTSTIHNVFDGIILHLIIIISVLSIVEFVDNYDETFVLVIAYLLIILPLTSFMAIKLWVNKSNIQNAFKHWNNKLFHKCTTAPIDTVEQPNEMNEIGIIVDDNMRKNAIIVKV